MTTAHVQETAEINRRHVWHYMIDSDIGDFHIVEHEDNGLGLVRDLVTDDNDKAEKVFKRAVSKILKGCPD